MELIYILTYDCNFRCKYCDVNKHDNSISREVIDQSLSFLEKSNFPVGKIKFFGGEPLLQKENIQYIVREFPAKIERNFYITTNSTLIDDDFMSFARNNNITLTFSLDGDGKATGENRNTKNWNDLSEIIIGNTRKYGDFIRVNQVITSKNARDFFANFKFIYDLWVRKFNFLPEYYSEWTREWLINLKKWFDQILDFYKDWNRFELINLENYSDISFFNLWLVIDTDGTIYWTNLILSSRFEKYKKKLKIWDVFAWITTDLQDKKISENYTNRIWSMVEKEYTGKVLQSVKYIDLILSNFCNKFEHLWNTKD